MVWRIVRRIGTDNGQSDAPSSLDRLLETGIITAAYPVHDGNIKPAEGEDPAVNTNDRRVSATRKQGRVPQMMVVAGVVAVEGLRDLSLYKIIKTQINTF